MGMKLFEHNQAAYDAAISMLRRTGKAAVIHPTGTGKSFIGFQLCLEHPEVSVCWLSPSEYIFQTQIENLRQAGSTAPENIRFCTYAKLMNLSPTELQAFQPGYIILDEFHRCGAELWGLGVQRLLELYPEIPVLGLSATNIRYLDNQRDMADELFDGHIASQMTLGEAIVRGILRPPKYVLSVYSYQKELERYTAMVRRAKNKRVRDAGEEYLEALRRAIDKADGLDEVFRKHMTDPHGKYIVFCSGKTHMDEMMACAKDWFVKVDPSPKMYSLYTNDPSTSKAFQAFKEDTDNSHLRLLFTINALNEGIHVSGINGVILLRPTVSPIVYKQQIGRALSASKGHHAVIFDIVMNIEHLYSIGAIEDEMREAVRYYTAEGQESEIVTERFRIIDEIHSCVELFEKLNETLSASWDTMYQEAKDYYEAHGDLNVPSRFITEEGYALGAWVTTQRQVRAGTSAGLLTQEQIAKLDAIGMRWLSASELQWERYYAAAKVYFEDNGDLNVPVSYLTEDGIPLGKWLSNLRTWKKGNQVRYLDMEKQEQLEAIGMVWKPNEEQWLACFAYARDYFQEHGNLSVPMKYVTEDGFQLGKWIQEMRRRKQFTRDLPEDRVRLLESIGMTWESKSVRLWEIGFSEYEQYVTDTGKVAVPISYVADSGYRLGGWADDQREKYRAGKLRLERFQRLDALGFPWEREDPWEQRYALAKHYYDEHHHLNVPAKFVVDGVWLNKWLNEQKQIYQGKRKGKSLTVDQITRLSALGVQWPESGPITV